jgi:O-antigen/teichoic acid export membrane protein
MVPSVLAPTADRQFRTDHLTADLRGRSVRGGAVTLSAQAVKFVLQLAGTAALARLLTPADFGIIAMVATITGFANLFKDLGLSAATIQKSEITQKQVSTLFWINVAASAGIGVVVAALAPAVAWFYGEPRLIWVTIILSGTFLFGGVAAQHTALLRRNMRFGTIAAIETLSLCSGIAAAIALAHWGASYWALVSMTAVQAASITLMSWLASGWNPGFPSHLSAVRSMLTFGAHLTGFNIANYFARNADNILIGHVLGAVPLGIYSKAYSLLLMPIRLINSPMTSVMIPLLSRLQNNPSRYRSSYIQGMRGLALFCMPVVVFAIVSADILVRVVLGNQWAAAAAVFQALGPAAFLGTFNVAGGWICLSMDRAERQLKWALVSAPITVGGFVVGLHWGVLGVAIAFSITECILRYPGLVYSLRGSPIRMRDLGSALWRPACASGAAGGLLCIVQLCSWINVSQNALLHLGIHAVIFCGLYVFTWMALPGGMRTLKHIMSQMREIRGRSS